MRFSTSKLLTIPLGLAAMLSACSGGETPTSPQQPSFAPSGGNPAFDAEVGKVKVCAFFGAGVTTATVNVSATAGTVPNASVVLDGSPDCAIVWTGTTGEVTTNLQDESGLFRVRVFYAVNGPADEDFNGEAAAKAANPVVRTVTEGNGISIWYKFGNEDAPPPPPPPPPGCTAMPGTA
jgi:hypothetical protein